jgi:hypothetical protein
MIILNLKIFQLMNNRNIRIIKYRKILLFHNTDVNVIEEKKENFLKCQHNKNLTMLLFLKMKVNFNLITYNSKFYLKYYLSKCVSFLYFKSQNKIQKFSHVSQNIK